VVIMSDDGFTRIKPHTLHKYNILRKYLNVCKTFDKVYSNFVYVDTHGGSGRVSCRGNWVDGSPLIASGWNINAPCHIVEINPETYSCLCESTKDRPNVHTYGGDCNGLIEQILSKIPKWRKFVFCFIDPNSLVYRSSDGHTFDQVKAETIHVIGEFPRTELLLNFPLEAILRCAGDFIANPETERGKSNGQRVTTFMGSESWKSVPLDRRNYLEIYMDEILKPYPYKGAILIRSEAKNLPLYYLVYTTHNKTAAKIMRDIMNGEGDFPIYFDLSKGRFPTFDEVYPRKRFIFER
jgi:three-Cys-motif partner protein